MKLGQMLDDREMSKTSVVYYPGRKLYGQPNLNPMRADIQVYPARRNVILTQPTGADV